MKEICFTYETLTCIAGDNVHQFQIYFYSQYKGLKYTIVRIAPLMPSHHMYSLPCFSLLTIPSSLS